MKFTKLICAIAAAAVAAGSAALSVAAEETTPAGYVYFMAEKNVIGQGFVVSPEKVAFYEGDTGLDIVERAAEVITEDSGYGAYITAFADEDIEGVIPEEISEVCPEMTGRTAEGYLSAYDYTSEAGWTYFINDEYAQVGISDYIPTDGDVLCFSFTVYGYGADLGLDNSSWGGAAALVPAVNKSELIRVCAESADAGVDAQPGLELLAMYNADQEKIDMAAEDIADNLAAYQPEETVESAEISDAASEESSEGSGKGSPATGVEGVAVAFAVVLLGGAVISLSRKQ